MKVKSLKDFMLESTQNGVVEKFAAIQHENWRKSFDPENSGKERIKQNHNKNYKYYFQNI